MRRFFHARPWVIAGTPLGWALGHTGPLLSVTAEPPAKPFRGGDFSVLRAGDSPAVVVAPDTARLRYAGGFDAIIHEGRSINRHMAHADRRLCRLADAHGSYGNEATGLHRRGGSFAVQRERMEDAEPIDMRVSLGTEPAPCSRK